MVFFPNEQMELWQYVESETDFNEYYEPIKEYNKIDTVPCDFQSMTPSESMKEFGEVLEDTYKVYLNIGVPIVSTMILRLQGKTDTYTIIGTPITNNHLPRVSHKKIIVQKQRKPVKLQESD